MFVLCHASIWKDCVISFTNFPVNPWFVQTYAKPRDNQFSAVNTLQKESMNLQVLILPVKDRWWLYLVKIESIVEAFFM